MKICPPRLKQGDTVGLIALSSPLKMEHLQPKLQLLEDLGLQYKLGKTIGAQSGLLAGNDDERLADLHEMLYDPEVKAIFCVRGGYGIARIADRIDYQAFDENPKIIWGFSDVTYLHTAISEYANVTTFHGPMLSAGEQELDELSKKMFLQLFNPIELQYSEAISPLEVLVGGTVRAELYGGNLNRLVSTLGTKFEADFKGKIVLLEDIGESVSRIDGMMNQLRLAKKLEQAAGFMIGSFTKLAPGETYADVVAVMQHYIGQLGKPAVAGFQIGHCEPNIAIPLGVEAILDADDKILRVLPGIE